MPDIFRTSTIPYTLIVGRTKSVIAVAERDDGEVDFYENVLQVRLQNVVLIQNPRETLNLNFYFLKYAKADTIRNYLCHAGACIFFENNLHEFNQHYVYEVFCERSQGEKEPPERLFTFFQKRTSNKCEDSLQLFLSSDLLNESLSFYIRRHNLEFCKREAEKCIDYTWLHQEIPAKVKLCVDSETILVHKFLLAHKSEVFKAMFTNEMTEAETDVVRIIDFGVDVIKEMVNFMYTGEESNINEMRYQLYKAAHKYQLHDLCFCCMEQILFNSNFDNIAETLELACLYDIKELKNSALDFVKNHPEEMSERPSYQDYMCRTMNFDNVVDTLLFAKLYKIEIVSEKAFDFIGQNFVQMKDNYKFNELFQSNPLLMKEIFYHYCKKYAGKVSN